MVVQTNEEIESVNSDVKVEEPMHEDSLVPRRVVNIPSKDEGDEKNHDHIFHTRCHMKDKEFEDQLPEEISHGLPPLREIKHQIDFTHGSIIPNRPTYRAKIGGRIFSMRRGIMEIEMLIKLMFPSANQVNVPKYSQNPLQEIGCLMTRDRYGRSSWVQGLL